MERSIDKCRPGRLLVVEDEEDIRGLLREILERHDYIVHVAANGARALDLIREFPIDLVLLDISMPGKDGFEVLSAVRKEHAPTKLPVIMVTGLGGRADIVKALQLGANDYVTKPLDMPVVLARIQTQLSHKRAVDQIVSLEQDLERRNEELESANRQLQKVYKQMKEDLESAAMVQRALLPDSPPRIAGVEITWAYRPCEELAGDILNVFQLDDDHLGLYLLDVSGHGVRAALLSVTLSRILTPLPDQPSLVRRASGNGNGLEPTPPSELAEELNRRFQLDLRAEQYFTLFYGVLNLRTFELRYINAGQPGPVYLPRDAKPQDLTEPVFAIGWVPEPHYEERRLQLRPGDRLYLYSDGLDESVNDCHERFGRQRIVEVVESSRRVGLAESVARIVGAAEEWAAERFDDDVSALAIEISEPASG
ncbi:MAG: SpoIIE family protein phosphatase [Planctomycetes bacterium]|nr:SpoIIE family protein phosphatase [Planctomycetota bacterium]